MTTSRKSHSHFKAGSGVFVCECCGHKTRHTGGDGADLGMCETCYDLAGYDNMRLDGNLTASDIAVVRGDFEWLIKHDRDEARLSTTAFPNLWNLAFPKVAEVRETKAQAKARRAKARRAARKA